MRSSVVAAGCALVPVAAMAQPAIARPGALAPLPLTQIDEQPSWPDLDGRTFSLTFAQPVPVREALVAFVRGTALSIVTDPDTTGTFIGDLKNVTVRQALEVVLPPLGLDYAVDGPLIRVVKRRRDTRTFDLNYLATERTSTVSVGSKDQGAAISTTTKADVFAEIASSVRALLSDRATVTVDRKAGLLQASDFPERLDRVAGYLESVQDRVSRQAQIDVRILEVELNDEKATGIDWNALSAAIAPGANVAPGSPPPPNGMRVADASRLLALLEAQGQVRSLASPRLLTLNNEPALVQTESVTFTVTPQISDAAQFTLSLSPIVRRPAAAEADMVARLADGETLVIAGFGHDRETRERRAGGISGGWFGRTTVVTRHRVELVILLTPRLVRSAISE